MAFEDVMVVIIIEALNFSAMTPCSLVNVITFLEDIIEKLLKKWKINVQESNSSHINFTLRKGHCPAVEINQTILPQTEVVKYLGLRFDCRFNLKEHIVKKNDLKTKVITG
jgi:hypothetical protein